MTRERSAKHCEVTQAAEDRHTGIVCHRCGAATALPVGQLPWVSPIIDRTELAGIRRDIQHMQVLLHALEERLSPKCQACGHPEHGLFPGAVQYRKRCTVVVPCPGYAGRECGCHEQPKDLEP